MAADSQQDLRRLSMSTGLKVVPEARKSSSTDSQNAALNSRTFPILSGRTLEVVFVLKPLNPKP